MPAENGGRQQQQTKNVRGNINKQQKICTLVVFELYLLTIKTTNFKTANNKSKL